MASVLEDGSKEASPPDASQDRLGYESLNLKRKQPCDAAQAVPREAKKRKTGSDTQSHRNQLSSFCSLPPEMHRTVFHFLLWRDKVRAFLVCKDWHHALRFHTTHIIADSNLSKLVATFPNIVDLSITYEPEFYDELANLPRLKSISWGGTHEQHFTNCPRRLLRQLALLPKLDTVTIHDKSGSCSTCTERYGYLTQIKTLIIARTTGFSLGIRKNICNLKNLQHLTLNDCQFDVIESEKNDASITITQVAQLAQLNSLYISKKSLTKPEYKFLREKFKKRLCIIEPPEVAEESQDEGETQESSSQDYSSNQE